MNTLITGAPQGIGTAIAATLATLASSLSLKIVTLLLTARLPLIQLMMDKILILELIGIPAIFILGSLFHFLYKYAGKKLWMAVISPVNESIWEHLKIAFYPGLAFAIIQFFVLNISLEKFFTAEIIGVNVMIIFILIAEWIYPSLLGKNVLSLDLLVFFLAITCSQLVSYYVYTSTEIQFNEWLIALLIATESLVFAVLTFKPPKLPLFRDSEDGKYGIK